VASTRRGGTCPALQAIPHRVVVYVAPGCHLCERALEVVREARAHVHFELDIVDIAGVPALEAGYRESIPVVEIDGTRAFTYVVVPDAFRARLSG
jgi:Glutaredoxin-like domain (DUF836)